MSNKGVVMSKKSLGGSGLYLIFGLVFIAVIGLRTISTPELWTHLALGRSNGPISFVESSSFVNTTWLYDKLSYLSWNIGGAPLLIVLNIAGLLAAFLLLIQVSKKWGGGIAQGFALLISGHLIFQTVDVGPRVVMMLFIALFLFVLNTRRTPAVLFGALIPLQILWTNMHASFLYGPLIAALAAMQAAQSAKAPGNRKKSQSPQSGQLGMLAGILLVCTLINPYFLKMHGQVIANLQSPSPAYWSSLFIEYFQIPALKPLILFTLVLGAAGLITLKKRLPVVLTTLAIYSAFLVWASPATAMLFVAMAFPFMVLSLTSVSEYLNHTLTSVMGEKAKLLGPATGAVLIVLIIVSMVPIIGNQAYVKTGSASTFGLGAEEQLYPQGLEELFNDPSFPETAINLAADGGYLAFTYGRKCFIDYRSGTYDEELLDDLVNMMKGYRKSYDTLYEKYRPEAFIINTLPAHAAQGVATLLRNPIWKLAYFDGTTAVILKNDKKFASILGNRELQQAGLAKLEAARAACAALDGKWKNGNPAELIGAGKIYLAFNRPKEAKAIFALLVQSRASIPAAWIGLGSSQILLKEFDAAIQSLEVAIRKSPKNSVAWREYAIACKLAGEKEKYEAAAEQLEKLAKENAKRQKDQEPDEDEADEVPAPKTESLESITIPE